MNTNQDSRPFQLSKALLCLGAAALFWFLNALNKPGYTLNVEYPIKFVYNDSLFIPTLPLPRTVKVNVSSDGWGLLRHSWLPFRGEPVSYVVKDPLHTSIINTASLAASLESQVKKLHVNHVIADTLDIQFDHRSTKTIFLKIDSLHINLVPPYVVSSIINVTPRTVQVSGPEKLVKGLPDTLLLRIPQKKITNNYDEEIALDPLRHPLLQAKPDRVSVSFEVGELLSPPNQ